MNWKRFSSILLVFALCLLCACGNSSAGTTAVSGIPTEASETGASGSTDVSEASRDTLPASSESPAASSAAETQALRFLQTGDLDLPVVQTEHFSFTKGEIVYMIAALSSNLGSYGVDGTKSLREQPYPAEEGKSWFDIISRDALGYAEEILLVCEDAQAGGLKLTEADEQEIVGIKETYTSSGESYGWDLDTYCQQVYGTNIRWAHIESFLRKSALANQVHKQISAMAFSQEELEKEFSANPKNYGLIDFYSVNFGDGEVIPQEVLDTAREAVKSSRNLEEFTAAVKTFLLAVKDPGEIESGGGIDAFTQQYLKTGQRTKVAYQNAEFFDWAFGDGVKEGDTFLVENEQTKAPYAYYLLRTPYKDTTVTVDIRHILFAVKDYKTAEEARSKADQIYADWVAQGASEDRFIELCAEYSADGNASSGGIYTNVYEGQMVQTFNDWCFDPERKSGDHGIVDTDFGSHMMYFITSHSNWEIQVKNALMRKAFNDILEKQKALTPVSTEQAVIDSIVW